MNPQTTVTAKSSDLPVTLAEAKTHLRVLGGDLDVHIQSLLDAATEYCESVVGRSLRVSQTLTQKYDGWPLNPVRFDRQPVLASVLVAEVATATPVVTYRDADDAVQTVAASNYRLHVSSEAAGYLEFDADFTRPTLSARDDAVTITYHAGYATIADVPPRAKAAVKLKLAELFGDLDPRIADANKRACDDLLGSMQWGCYR